MEEDFGEEAPEPEEPAGDDLYVDVLVSRLPARNADERFEFWMDLHQNVETSTLNVIDAVELRESVATRLQTFKDSGADAGRIKTAEEKAAVVIGLVDEYEGAFVAVGRTLAEILRRKGKEVRIKYF